MMDIGGGKLLWTTTSGFLKLRTLFGAEPRDGGEVDTSSRGNRTSRMTSIKHGKNAVLLSRREGSHDDGGRKQISV
jgi:hypothetical protein